MLEELTASQLEGWLAWMRHYQPFPNRHDPFFAMLISSWSQDSRPQDFLIYDDPFPEVSSEELASQIKALIPR